MAAVRGWRTRPGRSHAGRLARATSCSKKTTMGETVFDTFHPTARTAPDHVFLCAPPAAGRAYHPEGVEFTYGQTREAAEALRDAYRAAGYGHGHRVALLLENRPEFFFHFLAL